MPGSAAPSPSWFTRLSPGHRVAVVLGGVALSFVLFCCAGTAVVSTVFGKPEPARTSTSADESPQPVLAGPVQATEPSESTEPSETTGPSDAASPSAPATPCAPTSPPTSPSTAPISSSAAPSPAVQVRNVTETARIAYATRTVKDPGLAQGKRVVRTRGVDGVRTLTYRVTVTGGVQTGRKLINSVVTRKPVTQVVAVGTKPKSNCDSNFSPCVPIASDVDCAGGSGNGPAYVSGPVKVIGEDIYDLDRDNDGYGCDD